MEVTRVPLAERIEMARDGRTAQPEYLPSLNDSGAKCPSGHTSAAARRSWSGFVSSCGLRRRRT